MGTSCLALVWVMGRKRVPQPPLRIKAFIPAPPLREALPAAQQGPRLTPRKCPSFGPRRFLPLVVFGRRSEAFYGRGEGLSTPNTAGSSCSDIEHHPAVPAIPFSPP